jgi:hypothetical protein
MAVDGGAGWLWVIKKVTKEFLNHEKKKKMKNLVQKRVKGRKVKI